MPRQDYAARVAAKRERIAELAKRFEEGAITLINSGRDDLHMIPFGQPILVGHHSERRDRAFRALACRKIEKGIELSEKAEHYAKKAESIGTGGISSDDPEAIQKLEVKMGEAIAHRERWREIIRAIRLLKIGMRDPYRALNLTEDEETTIWASNPYFSYILANASANIRRIKERIEALRKEGDGQDELSIERAGYAIRENREENRIQVIFPGRPDDDTRARLKAYGFRWAPSQGAWQRHLNEAGRAAAIRLSSALDESPTA